MASATFERRAVPRYRLECFGELAAFSSVVPVKISDISTSGCGIEILGPVEGRWDDFKGCAILHLRPPEDSQGSLMLPALFTPSRVLARHARLGLQFASLTVQQSRSVLDLIDSLIERA